MKPMLTCSITGNDLDLDVGGQPLLTSGRASIAQDIIHMIRDSGLLVDVIANRDARQRRTAMVSISIAVDNDERIVPGSTIIEEPKAGEYWLTAQTVTSGTINLKLEA